MKTLAPIASPAQWIWSGRTTSRYNNFVCFRRIIEVGGPLKSGRLKITADSRYEVWINGQWLGHGPPRSWVEPWTVDAYDLAGMLVPGKNVIAVLVQEIGLGTFQYFKSEPGLLGNVAWEDGIGSHEIVTDGSWKSIPHDGYAARVPRISVQQAWEEQFDAGNAPSGISLIWRTVEYDDSDWPKAKVGRAAGEAPHAKLEARDIPYLTREPVEAARVVSSEIVTPARYTVSLDLRNVFNPDNESANIFLGQMFVATFIRSRKTQPIQLHYPHSVLDTKLNEKQLAFDDMSLHHTAGGIARATLISGWNVLLMKLPGRTHSLSTAFNIWTDEPVTFAPKPQESWGEPWLAIGPFPYASDPGWMLPPFVPAIVPPGATEADGARVWAQGGPSAEDLQRSFCRVVSTDSVAPVDVYAMCASERIVAETPAEIENLDALRFDTPEWTTIQPSTKGDTRILLDFGQTVVGYHEFEIDAPAGAIVDFSNFEFIQRDGRFNLPEGMNNSFRYTARQGVQRYRTFVRRGFRYSWVTFRNFDRPLRVRLIRLLQSTYPQSRRGAFECSDPRLTQIWEVGAHSVRSCSEDTYTDCPSYEQVHWIGDARNEALVDLVANGDPRLSRHAWVQAGRSLDRSSIVESHVPSAWENILPAWTFLWMRWAQEHFTLTGDVKFGKEAMSFLDRNFKGIVDAINDDGLFALPSWNLFDWADMDVPNDGIATHVNCLAVLGLNQSAQLANQLGLKSRANLWQRTAARLSEAVNKNLWDARANAYVDSIHADGSRSKVFSQQTHTAAYISGVASGARAKRSREIMERPPKGFVKAGSPFFMFFALEGLVRENRFAELIDTIRDYWWPQVEAGATTFWETYHPNLPRLTRSHCHGWSAAPTYFLSTYVLGIHPMEPGFAKVVIAPQTGSLAWAQGRVPTPRGVISVHWTRDESGFMLDVTLPPNTPAIVTLPVSGKIEFIVGKASKVSAARGQTSLRLTEPRLKCRVR